MADPGLKLGHTKEQQPRSGPGTSYESQLQEREARVWVLWFGVRELKNQKPGI